LLIMVQPMLQAREALRQQGAVLHTMVLEAVRASSVCRRLLSVPGVGPVVALTYATGIDDPARFAHSRDIGPHFGLIPRKYASGEIDRHGSITKAGDGAVREALVQAALTLLTRNQRWCVLKAWGVAVAKRRGLHRAIVAVARKLAIILHRIWVDGTTFTWSHDAAAKPA
jgi:transposase